VVVSRLRGRAVRRASRDSMSLGRFSLINSPPDRGLGSNRRRFENWQNCQYCLNTLRVSSSGSFVFRLVSPSGSLRLRNDRVRGRMV
jgi:hypothetical protein